MQPSQEHPKPSSRPSLLSSDDPSDSGNTGILGVLDDTSGRAGAASVRGKRIHFGWLAISVAVIATVAGGSAWWTAHTHKVVVLASTLPASSVPAPAAALASAPAESDASEVSTAAILHDVPDAQTPAAAGDATTVTADEALAMFGVDAVPAVAQPPLVMLAPVTPAADPAPVGPVAEPMEPKEVPAKAVARPAAKESDKAKRSAAVPAKRVQPARAAPEGQDSDVTLLAALVAHSKANEPKRSTTAAKLKQCSTLASVAEAESCRAKLCASSVNATECRSAPVAKASDEA